MTQLHRRSIQLCKNQKKKVSSEKQKRVSNLISVKHTLAYDLTVQRATSVNQAGSSMRLKNKT